VVAALGEQDAVLVTLVPPQNPDTKPVVADCDDVVAAQVIELPRQADSVPAFGLLGVAAKQVKVEAVREGLLSVRDEGTLISARGQRALVGQSPDRTTGNLGERRAR
jgi:hypothetical protein